MKHKNRILHKSNQELPVQVENFEFGINDQRRTTVSGAVVKNYKVTVRFVEISTRNAKIKKAIIEKIVKR